MPRMTYGMPGAFHTSLLVRVFFLLPLFSSPRMRAKKKKTLTPALSRRRERGQEGLAA